jgi:hypothetical protein
MRDAVDACLTKAFRDVAAPDGLAERLLAGLTVERRRCRSRRWLLAAGGLVAAAASIVLTVWLYRPRGPRASEEYAIYEAIQSFNDSVGQASQPSANQPALAGYPFSQQVLSLRGTMWRPLNDFLGRRGVVYDLAGPAGTSAALFVVAANGVEWGDTLPASQNPSTTAGCCASAWQENGLLYVLVVKGDPATYGCYLSNSPVA